MKLNKRRLLLILMMISGTVILVLFIRNAPCMGSESDYFQLPPSAQQVERHFSGLTRSCTLWIRFQMAPADLENFISTTFISLPLSSTNMPQGIGGMSYLQQETGWPLNSITTYLAGEASGTGERHLDYQIVLIDTSDSTQFTVYLTTKKNWL